MTDVLNKIDEKGENAANLAKNLDLEEMIGVADGLKESSYKTHGDVDQLTDKEKAEIGASGYNQASKAVANKHIKAVEGSKFGEDIADSLFYLLSDVTADDWERFFKEKGVGLAQLAQIAKQTNEKVAGKLSTAAVLRLSADEIAEGAKELQKQLKATGRDYELNPSKIETRYQFVEAKNLVDQKLPVDKFNKEIKSVYAKPYAN